jgi:phage gp46-like protein
MLKLVQTDWGRFDLAFDDPANDDAAAAVATLIYAVLFTDAVAPASREPDAYLRRGWWADPAAGSGLWHVRRQALSSAARREAIAMVQTALMTRAPALTGVEVNERTVTESAGNISSVQIEVSGFHNRRKFIVKAPL